MSYALLFVVGGVVVLGLCVGLGMFMARRSHTQANDSYLPNEQAENASFHQSAPDDFSSSSGDSSGAADSGCSSGDSGGGSSGD